MVTFFRTAQAGNLSILNGIDTKGKMPMVTSAAIIAVPDPAIIICFVGMLHGAATSAFGGVAIGRQKAKEQLKVVAIIRYIGCHFAETDISAITGSRMLATATLLENI